MDRRAVVRLAAVSVVSCGALAVAVQLGPGGVAGASASPMSATDVAARTVQPVGVRADARAGLERTLARPAALAGTDGVFPDAADLGPLHDDPMPPGTSLRNPTDTTSLLRRAGDVQAALVARSPVAAAATAPIGTPTIGTLTHHVVPSCSGTGTDGNRVQVLYLHEAGTRSRLAGVQPVLRNAVADVDDVYAVSAQQTGGQRRVRWVHDQACLPVIKDVTLPAGALGKSFDKTVSAVRALGFTNPARKYLMFADANRFCGIASVYLDPSRTGNANDGRYPSYARVDANCWSSTTSVPAHELTHTLGSVLPTAPHHTANGHCYDDADLMCYDDGSGVPMKQVCPSSQEQLLDCHHDDYFNTNPARGSFLARSWNTASSSFLDSVLTTPPPPTVRLTASTRSARTGATVRLTATSPSTVSWVWSTSARGSACSLRPSSGTTSSTATLVCPSGVVGDVVVTATATREGAAKAGRASVTVAMTGTG